MHGATLPFVADSYSSYVTTGAPRISEKAEASIPPTGIVEVVVIVHVWYIARSSLSRLKFFTRTGDLTMRMRVHDNDPHVR